MDLAETVPYDADEGAAKLKETIDVFTVEESPKPKPPLKLPAFAEQSPSKQELPKDTPKDLEVPADAPADDVLNFSGDPTRQDQHNAKQEQRAQNGPGRPPKRGKPAAKAKAKAKAKATAKAKAGAKAKAEASKPKEEDPKGKQRKSKGKQAKGKDADQPDEPVAEASTPKKEPEPERNAPKRRKLKAQAETTPSPTTQAKDNAVDSAPKEPKEKSFARRVRPKNSEGSNRWQAIRDSFGSYLRDFVPAPISSHEVGLDSFCVCLAALGPLLSAVHPAVQRQEASVGYNSEEVYGNGQGDG